MGSSFGNFKIDYFSETSFCLDTICFIAVSFLDSLGFSTKTLDKGLHFTLEASVSLNLKHTYNLKW